MGSKRSRSPLIDLENLTKKDLQKKKNELEKSILLKEVAKLQKKIRKSWRWGYVILLIILILILIILYRNPGVHKRLYDKINFYRLERQFRQKSPLASRSHSQILDKSSRQHITKFGIWERQGPTTPGSQPSGETFRSHNTTLYSLSRNVIGWGRNSNIYIRGTSASVSADPNNCRPVGTKAESSKPSNHCGVSPDIAWLWPPPGTTPVPTGGQGIACAWILPAGVGKAETGTLCVREGHNWRGHGNGPETHSEDPPNSQLIVYYEEMHRGILGLYNDLTIWTTKLFREMLGKLRRTPRYV